MGLDDKLIVFKSNCIFAIYGSPGPNALGMGNQYSNQKIESNIGLYSKGSLCKTPMGIIFQAQRGIFLVSKQLQVQFIGAGVDDYSESSTYPVTSAVFVQNIQRAYLSISSAKVTLVFDLLFNRWTTEVFSTLENSQMVPYKGSFATINTTGNTIQVRDTTYRDGTTSFGVTYKSPWYAMDQINGYQRLYEVNILGKKLSNCTWTVKVYYDYSTTASQTVTIDTSASSFVVNADGYYTVRIIPTRSHCKAFQIEVVESNAASTYGACEICDIQLVVGVTDSLSKSKVANTYA